MKKLSLREVTEPPYAKEQRRKIELNLRSVSSAKPFLFSMPSGTFLRTV